MKIIPYNEQWHHRVCDLISTIQQTEFGISISLENQPDLMNIQCYYQKNNGNFWLAIDQNILAGTISLMDIGNNNGALRKMFVHPSYRGKKGTAQNLFDVLYNHAINHEIKNIYLGTTNKFIAAHRFYEKNKFERITPDLLPASFPIMKVDSIFYKKTCE